MTSALENVVLNPGVGGEKVAVDTVPDGQVSPVNVQAQAVKILLGASGTNGGLVDSANPLPITGAIVSAPSSTATPVAIVYDDIVAVAGAQANQYFAALKYTVPAPYKLIPASFLAVSADNRCSARAATTLNLGTFDISPNAFVAGSAYSSPAFGSFLELEVTTATGGTDTVVTVTYTNSAGVGGRVGAVTVKKNTPVGYKFSVPLAAGDIGVRSVQSVSRGAATTGALEVRAGVGLWEVGLSTSGATYSWSLGFPAFQMAAGTVVELAWKSNAAATVERSISVIGSLEVS